MAYRNPHDFPSEESAEGFWWDREIVDPDLLDRAIPPTNWDEQALAHIESHIETEEKAEEAYEAFARSNDPQVRYLAQLIAADEHRHHRMLAEIANSLRARVSETKDTSPTAPTVPLTPEASAELSAHTQRLLAMEEHDVGELNRLRRELRSDRSASMWPLLVEIMELDTEKHIRILKAIERHLARHRWPR